MEVKEARAAYQVAPAYKYTEVGLIPQDWDVALLHKLADKIMVGIASAATHAYRDRGVVMFRNQNIKPGYLDDSDVLFIAEDYEVTFKNKRLKPGDLLTARTGYPGTTSLVPRQYEGAQSFTTLITRPRRGSVDHEYLCCYINSAQGQKYFEQAQIGGGQKNVNVASLKLLPVSLPPTLNEQQAIATALGDADALIEALEQLLAKKRQIKQGAMQELLTGQRRLPGFAGEWCVKELGVIADVIDPHPSHRAPHEVSNGIPFVGIGDLDEAGNIVGRKLRLVSAEVLNEHALRYTLGEELIGLGRVASIGKVVALKCHASGYAVSPTLGVIRPRDVKYNYLLYSLKSAFVSDQFSKIMSGSTRSSVGMEVLRELEIPFPVQEEEQTAIATVLADMDADIAALEAKLAKARDLKQGMMQQLLTGRIRLV